MLDGMEPRLSNRIQELKMTMMMMTILMMLIMTFQARQCRPQVTAKFAAADMQDPLEDLVETGDEAARSQTWIRFPMFNWRSDKGFGKARNGRMAHLCISSRLRAS